MTQWVCVELPGASPFDAQAFGLWLESTLRAAREDGNLDTAYGLIKVMERQATNFGAFVSVRGGAGGAGGAGGLPGAGGSAYGQGGSGGGGSGGCGGASGFYGDGVTFGGWGGAR